MKRTRAWVMGVVTAAAVVGGCANGGDVKSTDFSEQKSVARGEQGGRGGQETDVKNDVLKTLDAFHDAASKADEERYFALFAPEGVFIGTDAKERWSVAAFRAYAHPFFAKGKGWTYTPIAGTRHVDASPDGTVAWFDELLTNAKYGTCRGSGVLRQIGGAWRVCQYHLTMPVPNEMLERVAVEIRVGH